MSDVDEYLELSEDPEMAFVEYEGRRRKELFSNISDIPTDNYGYIRDEKAFYVAKIIGFHDAHDFSFLNDPNLRTADDDFDNKFDAFLMSITKITTQLGVRHARRLKPISITLTLTEDIRRQLHSYINKMREVLSPINLPARKKEDLFKKINLLADEIDRDRTKGEAYTALVIEIASVAGNAAQEMEPVRRISDSIGNLFGKAKNLADSILGLPGPSQPKRIEAPKKQLPAPKAAPLDDGLDDVPF
ncbi:MAG: hypothetical protein WAS21_06120 [Geminicoccaceae bacterium]